MRGSEQVLGDKVLKIMEVSLNFGLEERDSGENIQGLSQEGWLQKSRDEGGESHN
jgi:hypothetical protein